MCSEFSSQSPHRREVREIAPGDSLMRLPRSDDSAWRSRLADMARLTRSTTARLMLLVLPPGDCDVVYCCWAFPVTARLDWAAGTADLPLSCSATTAVCGCGNGVGTALGSKSDMLVSSCASCDSRGRSSVAIRREWAWAQVGG